MANECATSTSSDQLNQNDTLLNQNDTHLVRKKRRSGSLYQPIQGERNQPRRDPLLEQLDLSQLETVMEAELGCLERIGQKMNRMSEEICEDPDRADTGNSQCWTGTTLGK